MSTSSYGLLQKILGLTSSSNDNERKAAKLKLDQLLEKHGVTLEAVSYTHLTLPTNREV